MSSIFLGRNDELQSLEDHYSSKKAEFIVLYGRRRIGKTELIKQFSKNKRAFYYLCTKEDLKIQIQRIAKLISEKSKLTVPLILDFDDFGKFIQSISEQERFILAIDEFPFLIEGNEEATSVWQRIWDEFLSKTKIFMILCGSSISMMESEVLGTKSPLYGRRTGQIKLGPLSFLETIKFYPKFPIEKAVYFFSITDGIPFYILEMDPKLSFLKNIEENIARKDKLLYEEPELLLKEELREPRVYNQILRTIASGATKVTDICNKSGIPQNQITKYLNVLIDLQFIKKKIPVTIKKETSKQTLYFIKDNFLHFYYKFIEPNKYLVEQDKQKELSEKIEKELDSFIGKWVFEDVILSLFEKRVAKAPFVFSKSGSWWNRQGKEIDIILINEEEQKILFCEVKWTKLNQKERIHLERELKEKAMIVDWRNEKRKEYYIIFDKTDLEKISLTN